MRPRLADLLSGAGPVPLDPWQRIRMAQARERADDLRRATLVAGAAFRERERLRQKRRNAGAAGAAAATPSRRLVPGAL
jgi:hypothetical protein